MSGREPPDPEEQTRRQAEMQSQSVAANAAIEKALREQELDREDFIDKLRAADVDGMVVEDLEEQLGPYLSGVYPIANLTPEDHHRHRWLNENEAERQIAAQNPGRLCRGALLELAQGTHRRPDKWANQPRTPDEERVTREAITGVRTAFQSLGKGGEGLSAVADITAVTEHRQRSDDDDGSGGRFRGAMERVFS